MVNLTVCSFPVSALGTHRKEDGAFRMLIWGPDQPQTALPQNLRPIKAPGMFAEPWISF